MESQKNQCQCHSEDFVVMACSGASDLGHITDLAARKLRDNGVCKMNCLAVIGAGIDSSIEVFRKQDLLIIDGCTIDCGKRMMERYDITNYKYLRLTDLGFVKGKTPVTDEHIQLVYDKAVLIH